MPTPGTEAATASEPAALQIARWTIAMPYVLKAHVTELDDPSVQLQVLSA